MGDLATLVQRAVMHSRDGHDALAIAAIREALRGESLDKPTRAFLDYVRAIATVDRENGVDCWPTPEIGDDLIDPEVARGSSALRRWAEARWVTPERIERLRAASKQDWSIKAPQLAVAFTAQARNLVRQGMLAEAATTCREAVALLRGDDLRGAYEGRRGDALRLLGAIECSSEAFKAASAASAEACRIFRALSPGGRERHLEPWASASHNLAGARLNEGDIGGAVAAMSVVKSFGTDGGVI